MKFAIVLTVLATGLLLAAGDSQVDTTGRIRELHKERIATLKEFLDLKQRQRDGAGEVSLEELFQARLQLLNAELESAETDQDRIKIHESIVRLFKEYEVATERGFKTGEINFATKFKAKADRLYAEIAFERAKAGANKRIN